MLIFSVKKASTDQYQLFLDWMQEEASDYIRTSIELIGMSLDEFAELFQTVGQVYGVYLADKCAGFYWIEEREQIFDVFWRGSTSRGKTGTGIGLATIQKIASLFNGRSWVEETPGGGSTFCVEFFEPLDQS